ncbi:MAG: hypothetical protein KF708_06405 [Pirellulales bacterium]|nr:hypothetical protein [Pirellulales bacterium]
MPRRWLSLVQALVCAALWALIATAARADGDFREEFESPVPSWRQLDGNVPFRVEQHARVHDNVHWGSGAEYLRLSAGNGTYIRYAHDVPSSRVIEDLQIGAWVKSGHAGVQIFARVVLPRTADPRSGRPVVTLLPGSSYAKVGAWEQLRLERVPLLLERQTRLLRAELRRDVDTREAFVDRVLINVYGGQGTSEIWIDDLEMTGCYRPTVLQAGYRTDEQGAVAVAPDRPAVRLVGDLLTVGDVPMFPRVVQYRGEPLQFLQGLGFNVVHIDTVPSRELLDEAARLDMWLVCPPPLDTEFATQQGRGAGQRPVEIGSAYNRVLMWHLGSNLARPELERTNQWARAIRLADREHTRPTIGAPLAELGAYSRAIDVLTVGRQPLASTLELPEYAAWLATRSRLARPGTPIWAEVQTHLAPAVVGQWRAFTGREPPGDTVTADQLRLLVYTALSSAPRGLYFSTRTRLDGSDAAARQRALALELLNAELALIEPWTASGQLVATIEGTEAGSRGIVFRTDRSRLLLPFWAGRGAQFVPAQVSATGISFTVPAVPDSHRAYELTPSGLASVRDKKRVAGGTRVTLDEFGVSAMVVLTEDSLTLGHLQRELRARAPRAAQLARELAIARSLFVERMETTLAARAPVINDTASPLRDASRHVSQSEQLLAAGDYAGAFAEARRAMRPLRMLERARWEQARQTFESVTASPFAVTYDLLPQHWVLVGSLGSAEFGRNQLVGGNLERLETLSDAGWHHYRHDHQGIESSAELSPQTPNSGRFSLKLAARASDPKNPPGTVETSPVWITTPGIPVEAGQLFRLRAFVRVPAPITGSVDGLLVLDSFGGEALAERIRKTDGWQEIILYRTAPARGELRLTFALSGLGEAYLDDVAIEPVLRSPSRPVTPQAAVPGLPLRR